MARAWRHPPLTEAQAPPTGSMDPKSTAIQVLFCRIFGVYTYVYVYVNVNVNVYVYVYEYVNVYVYVYVYVNVNV